MAKKRENWNIEVNKKIINHSCAAHETNACNHATQHCKSCRKCAKWDFYVHIQHCQT